MILFHNSVSYRWFFNICCMKKTANGGKIFLFIIQYIHYPEVMLLKINLRKKLLLRSCSWNMKFLIVKELLQWI